MSAMERLTDTELVEWAEVARDDGLHRVGCGYLDNANCSCQAPIVFEQLIDELVIRRAASSTQKGNQ